MRGKLTPVRQYQGCELNFSLVQRREIAVYDGLHPLPLSDGQIRVTAPCPTVPAGTTSLPNAKTGSRTFAPTGAPAHFDTRSVKYRGAPDGTLE